MNVQSINMCSYRNCLSIENSVDILSIPWKKRHDTRYPGRSRVEGYETVSRIDCLSILEGQSAVYRKIHDSVCPLN